MLGKKVVTSGFSGVPKEEQSSWLKAGSQGSDLEGGGGVSGECAVKRRCVGGLGGLASPMPQLCSGLARSSTQ